MSYETSLFFFEMMTVAKKNTIEIEIIHPYLFTIFSNCGANQIIGS